MAQHRFDDLTRVLASRNSRRRVLRGLVAGAAAALGATLPGRDATAQGCPPGTEMCGGTCSDVLSDPQNCGACGNVCSIIDGITYEDNACVDGVCTTVCGADTCGDECIDLATSPRHCGACGNACAAGEMCCGGRCFNPDHYERYCDWCGYQGGFPQGCNADEVCDGGLCIPVATQQATETAEPTETQAATETATQATEPAPEAATEAAAAGVPPTGQLAYALRDGQHWSVWTHDLATGQNTALANVPASDQFAPAWSHDGTRIAYLSDQAGGVNQAWLLDAAGVSRQLSAYASAGSLTHIAWSWDDAALVVTEAGADGVDRLLALPPEGGALTPFTDLPGGWPSFAEGDRMAFVGEGDAGAPLLMMQIGGDLRADVVPDALLGGETTVGEPCLAPSGTTLALSIGEPGARRVIAFGPWSDRPVPRIPPAGQDASNPAWSPDESQLAVVAVDGGGQSIVIHALDVPGTTPAAIPLPPHDRVWYLSWNPAAGPAPLPATGAEPIEAATEVPDSAVATEAPASLGETFTSATYGWQYTWDPAVYAPSTAIEPELLSLRPVDAAANDWTFLVGTVDATNPFPIPKISIVPFTPDICAGQPAITGGWTPVRDPLTERFFRATATSSLQVVHGVGPVWGAAGCGVLAPGEAAVFLHATASDTGDPETLFRRLDAILAGLRGVSL